MKTLPEKNTEPEVDEQENDISPSLRSESEEDAISESDVSEDAAPILPIPTHAGPLLKRGRRGQRSWLQRWFTLDKGELHFSDVASQHGVDIHELAAISTLPLSGCRVSKTEEMPELCFNVVNSANKIKVEIEDPCMRRGSK